MAVFGLLAAACGDPGPPPEAPEEPESTTTTSAEVATTNSTAPDDSMSAGSEECQDATADGLCDSFTVTYPDAWPDSTDLTVGLDGVEGRNLLIAQCVPDVLFAAYFGDACSFDSIGPIVTPEGNLSPFVYPFEPNIVTDSFGQIDCLADECGLAVVDPEIGPLLYLPIVLR